MRNHHCSFSPMMDIKSGMRRQAEEEYYRFAKKGRFEYTPKRDEVPHREEVTSNKTEDMEFTCPQSSALLHTPLVMRTVVPDNKESHTPHSILKSRSATNTPGTPATEKSSFLVSRQIRFSFPKENLETSIESCVVEDEHSSPPVTPRKSIHQASSIKDRKGTPANPRILRNNLRNTAVQLQFDDNETVTKEFVPEISATAATLLKNISQSAPRSPLYSSPSQNTRSKSNLSFKLPHGLDGNSVSIEEMENNSSKRNSTILTDDEMSSNEESYFSLRSSSPSREMPSRECNSNQKSEIYVRLGSEIGNAQMDDDSATDNVEVAVTDQDGDKTLTNQTIQNSVKVPSAENLQSNENIISDSIFQTDDVKSPKEVTISVQGIGSSSFSKKVVKSVDHNLTGESINKSKSSYTQDTDSDSKEVETSPNCSDSQLKKTTLKWITTENTIGNLLLEVNKGDESGKDTCIARVTVSEEMQMFYSEPAKETKSNNSDVSDSFDNNQDNSVLGNLGNVPETFTKINQLEEIDVDKFRSEDNIVEEEKDSNKKSVNITETNRLLENSEEIAVPVTDQENHKYKEATIYVCESVPVGKETDSNEISLNIIERGENSEQINIPQDLMNCDNDILSGRTEEHLNKAEFSAIQLEQNMQDNSHFHETYECVPDNDLKVPEQIFDNKFMESNKPFQEDSPPIIVADVFSVQELPESNEPLVTINESFGSEGSIVEPVSELNEFERTGNCTDFELKVSDEEENDISNIPENCDEHVLTSLKPLKADPIEDKSQTEELEEDFELKVSDEEENDISNIPENCDEHVLTSLKPLEADPIEDKSQTEELEENNYYEEDDIYADLEEGENINPLKPSKLQSLDRADDYHRSSGVEVVSLSSESEDEMQKKALVTSTPYQETQDVKKYHKISEDSLDFEEDMSNEEKNDEDSSSYSSKSESQNTSNYSGEDGEISSSSSSSSKSLVSSDSNSEVHHENRSWKCQRKREISVEEKDFSDAVSSVESPEYELIGQKTKMEISCGRNSENTDEVILSSEGDDKLQSHPTNYKASIDMEHVESREITEQSNTPVTCSVREENVHVNEAEIDPVSKLTETQSDVSKLVETKQKECAETGSLLDLKSKRSKRFGSDDNLTFNKVKKSRRKSCSMNDLASVMIAEQVLARRKSMSGIDLPTLSSTTTEKNIPNSCEDPFTTENTPVEGGNVPGDSFLTEPVCKVQGDSESSSSKVDYPIADRGRASPELSFAPDISKSLKQKGSMPEYLKRQSKLFTSRFSCNLQDISEEMSAESSSLLHHTGGGRRSLRKSGSNEQLKECHFEQGLNRRRSRSISAFHDFTETTIEPNISENNQADQLLPLEEIEEMSNQPTPCISRADEITGSSKTDNNLSDLTELNMGKSVELAACNSDVVLGGLDKNNDLKGFVAGEEKTKRTRAHSEPPVFKESDVIPGMSTRRKSYSLLKVESIHKRLFPRPNNRKSIRESLYQSLEIIDSDDSFKESRRSRVRPKIHRSSQDIARKGSSEDCRLKEDSFKNECESSKKESLHDSESQPDVFHEEFTCSEVWQGPSTSNRFSRATSEPPSYIDRGEILRPKRRSSSLLKINRINELLFGRNYLRKSRSRSSCFQNLEVVNSSDEENSMRGSEVATCTSDTFDGDMENIIAPHVVIKENRQNKKELDEEIPQSEPREKEIDKDSENASKGRKRLKKNIAKLNKPTVPSRQQEVEETQSSDFESMITIHEVQKKLKKSDLKQNKTSKIHKLNLAKFRRKRDGKESELGDSTSEISLPPKKRSRIINLDQVDHDTTKQKDTLEGMEVNTNDTENKQVLKSRSKKPRSLHIKTKTGDVTNKKFESENDIDEPLTDSPMLLPDNDNSGFSQKEKGDFTESEPPDSINKKSEKKKKVSKITKHTATKITKQNKIKENKQGPKTKNNTKKSVRQSSTKKTKKTGKKILEDKVDKQQPEKSVNDKADEQQPKQFDVREKKITSGLKKSTSNKVMDKKVEEKQLQQSGEVVIKSTEEATQAKNGQKNELKEDDSLRMKHETGNKDIEADVQEPPTKLKRGRKKEKPALDLDPSVLDSPARRTRRSVSRLSDTELLASPLALGTNNRVLHSKAMSDVVSSPLKSGHPESEARGGASQLTTPTRRSTRRLSQSTPVTPDMKQDDYLNQRRLTRNQHQQMQKSFELSLTETSRPTRLEDLPEETAEIEKSPGPSETAPNTPSRSSARNANKKVLNYSLTKSSKTKPSK